MKLYGLMSEPPQVRYFSKATDFYRMKLKLVSEDGGKSKGFDFSMM
jgi:hypothetical protein